MSNTRQQQQKKEQIDTFIKNLDALIKRFQMDDTNNSIRFAKVLEAIKLRFNQLREVTDENEENDYCILSDDNRKVPDVYFETFLDKLNPVLTNLSTYFNCVGDKKEALSNLSDALKDAFDDFEPAYFDNYKLYDFGPVDRVENNLVLLEMLLIYAASIFIFSFIGTLVATLIGGPAMTPLGAFLGGAAGVAIGTFIFFDLQSPSNYPSLRPSLLKEQVDAFFGIVNKLLPQDHQVKQLKPSYFSQLLGLFANKVLNCKDVPEKAEEKRLAV